MPHPIVALYARVSTRQQQQQATIASQIAQLLQYAQQQQYEIRPEHQYLDDGVSGKRLVRPSLERLRDAAYAQEIQVVLCTSPDRLARDLGVQQMLLREFQQAQVTVIFIDHPADSHDPQTALLQNIQGAFAEYERAQISERMRRGKLHRLRAGQSVPSQPPYGYRYQPRTAEQPAQWQEDAAAAAVVRQIFTWYAEGGWSVSRIAQTLHHQATPGPGGKGWHASTVGRVLRQSAYRGQAYYNRQHYAEETRGLPRKQGRGRLQFPRPTARPVEEWITVPVPALITPTLWATVQERLQMNTRFAPRNSRQPYLLRGLLVCGVCAHTLQGRTQGSTVTYFCPYGGTKRAPHIPAHSCTLRADVIEPLLWQTLSAWLQHPQRLQTAWDALQAETAPLGGTGHLQRQRQQTLQQQVQRLVDAYQIGVITLAELQARRNPLQQELQTLTQQLAQAAAHAAQEPDLARFTQLITQALQAADVPTQQEIIRLLIERIVVTDGALTVEHIIPTVNDSRLHPTFRDA